MRIFPCWIVVACIFFAWLLLPCGMKGDVVDLGVVAEQMQLNAVPINSDPNLATYGYTSLQFFGDQSLVVNVDNGQQQSLGAVLFNDLGAQDMGSLSFNFPLAGSSSNASGTLAQNTFGLTLVNGAVTISPVPRSFTLTSVFNSHGANVGDQLSLNPFDTVGFTNTLETAQVLGSVSFQLNPSPVSPDTTVTLLQLGSANGHTYEGEYADTTYVLRPVPEPGTVALLATGAIFLIVIGMHGPFRRWR